MQGYETTATALAFTVWCLAANPKKAANLFKVRVHVFACLQTFENFSLPVHVCQDIIKLSWHF